MSSYIPWSVKGITSLLGLEHDISIYERRLDWSKQEIRLIEILPEDSPSLTCLQLKVHYVSLQDTPSFTALSYAWGDQNKKELVLINGTGVQITVSLVSALEEIRRKQKEDTSSQNMFWIDQLCINQKDDLEKQDQVRNMDKIYKQANDVFIWLGDADENTSTVFSDLQHFASLARDMGVKDYTTALDNQRSDANSFDESILKIIISHPVFSHNRWPAVSRLFSRNWWQRAWVLQEVTLARSATMASGSARIEWADMITFLAAIELFICRMTYLHIPDMSADGYLSHHALEVSAKTGPFLRMPSHINTSLDLVFMVYQSPNEQMATDPRDQIYSRLSLMKETDRAQITVRYDNAWTCRKLYAQVTGMMIQQDGPSILQSVQLKQQPAALDLPTWVINFNGTEVDYNCMPIHSEAFSACGAAALKTFTVRVDGDADVLYLQGGEVDSIKHCAKVFPHATFDVEDDDTQLDAQQRALKHVEALCGWINDFKNILTAEGKVYSTVELDYFDDAMWRTCIGDCGGAKIPVEVLEGYKALMGQIKPPEEYKGEYNLWQLEKSMPFIRHKVIRGRTPFVTSHGYIGTAKYPVSVGDSVYLVQGGRVPFIFDKKENGQFGLKSEAYLHGIMYGEIFNDEENHQLWEEMEIC